MQSLREYLLFIVAACLIASLASGMVKSALVGRVVRLISGILILLVTISPLVHVDLKDISDTMSKTGDTSAISDVQERTKQQFASQIQAATEEHIEKIAEQMGLVVQAKVTLDDAQIPTPIAVELIASLQPEQIVSLAEYIEQNIGISKENQRWRGYEAGT